MSFEIKLVPDDWWAFNRYLYKKVSRGSTPGSFLKSLSIWFVIGFSIQLIAKTYNHDALPSLLGALAILAILISNSYLKQRSMRKYLTPRSDSFFTSPQQVTLSEAGLELVSLKWQARYTWPSFTSAQTTNDLLMLFLDSSIAIIIPFRGLNKAELLESLERVSGLKVENG
ncbi:MAG: YcxB family protein [Proteobacteria bacterium]|nr:YcxB family protein [Pseudomonadota bacterium]